MTISTGVGLISGLNFTDIISQLSAVNSRPIGFLRNDQAKLAARQNALQLINQKLLDFDGSLNTLTDASQFSGRTINNPEFTKLAATVDRTGAIGSFTIDIKQLAEAERRASQGIADTDETAIASGSGKFTIKVGEGEAIDINVTGTTTLAQIRDAINANTDIDVRASIINDGSATEAFRLVLTSKTSGEASKIEIVQNDTSLDFTNKTIESAAASDDNQFDGTVASSGTYTGAGTRNIVVKVTTAGALGVAQFAVSTDGGLTFGADNEFTTSASPQDISGGEGVLIAFAAGTADFAAGDTFSIDAFDPLIKAAQDALVQIDGIQVRRTTNTIEDALDGITITAKQVTDEPVTITTAETTGNVEASIKKMVKSYNELKDLIKKLAGFEAETETRGPLFGDAGVRSIRSSLQAIVTSTITGAGEFNSLGKIGVSFDADGRLSVDSTKLKEALEEDTGSVTRLFARVGTSTSSGIQFKDSTEQTTSGTFAVSITTPAAKAAFDAAQAVDPGGVALDETLTIGQASESIDVFIAAGTSLDDAVKLINELMAAQGLSLTASNDGGTLRIESNDFGSAETFTLVSDRDGGVSSQLGIGTTVLTQNGVNVAGFINGVTGLGAGQLLKGVEGTGSEGLELDITSASPVNGVVTVTRGIAESLSERLQEITDSTDGLIKTKTDSLTARSERIDDRIVSLNKRVAREEERLRRQFVNLELKLASLQSQGNFLLSQLAGLIGSTRF